MSNPTSFQMSRDWPFLLALFGIVVVLRGAMMWDYINSSLLIWDDAIYIGSFLLRDPVQGPQTQAVSYGILNFLSRFGVVAVPKLSLLVVQFGVAVCIYALLNRATGSRWAAASLSVLISLAPIAPDQNYFMSASHPSYGTLFFLVSLTLLSKTIYSNWVERRRLFLLSLFAQGLLLLASGFSSPAFTLAPTMLIVATAILLLVAGEKKPNLKLSAVYLAISVLPAAFYFARVRGHHYAEKSGFVDMDPTQVFSNLGRAMEFLIAPFESNPIILFGTITGLAIAIVSLFVAIIGKNESATPIFDKRSGALGVYTMIASAVTFGPASVIVSMLNRHTAPAFLLGTLALALFLAPALRRGFSNPNKHSWAMQSSLALTASIMIPLNVSESERNYEGPLASHKVIKSAIDVRSWQDQDQILIVMPPNYRITTGGYNHWSTWYLRVLTGNPNVIGLVGTNQQSSDLDADSIFVDQYRDHDPAYWGERDGRSFRKAMMGLERDRSLFVFKPDDQNALQIAPALFLGSKGGVEIGPGETANFKQSGDGRFCSATQETTPLIIPGKSLVPDMNFPEPFSYSSDGQSAIDIAVTANPQKQSILKVRLSRSELREPPDDPTYSDTYPPMPLLGPDFAIYDLGESFVVSATKNRPVQARVNLGTREELEVVLFGCPGNSGMLVVNGKNAGFIEGVTFAGQWTLGRGYLDRYWRGNIVEFSHGSTP